MRVDQGAAWVGGLDLYIYSTKYDIFLSLFSLKATVGLSQV